jgi:hypothetical protein
MYTKYTTNFNEMALDSRHQLERAAKIIENEAYNLATQIDPVKVSHLMLISADLTKIVQGLDSANLGNRPKRVGQLGKALLG